VPLTTAHAAAAWPLARLAPALPTAALVIGTFSPDFIYLLRLRPGGGFGHTLPGVFLFCLPVSLVVWALFEHLVRGPLTALLPPGVQDLVAAPAAAPSPVRLVALAAVAAVIGAFTHLAWDSFTHLSGWVVVRLPVLATPIREGSKMRWYRLLQEGGSLLGTLATLAWALLAVRRVPLEGRRFAPGQALRTALVVAALLLATAAAGVFNGMRPRHFGFTARVGYAAVGMMDGLALALLVFGLIARFRRAPER
jgi:hypothetical protein